MRIEGEITDAIEKRVRTEFDRLGRELSATARAKIEAKLNQVRAMIEEALPQTGLRDITE
jgi:hypothetical protein